MFRAHIVEERSSRELRRSVLRPNLPADAPLPGDELTDAVHLGVVADGGVVGTCFVYPDPCPWRPAHSPWRLRQMATDPGWRGRGVGGAVLIAARAVAVERGADLLWCYARATAESFYAAHGWSPVGDIFPDERQIPHRPMELPLTADAS